MHRRPFAHASVVATFLVVLLAALVASAGTAPSASAAERDVAAWLPYWTQSTATATLVRERATVGVTSPFWYVAGEGPSDISGQPGAGNAAVLRSLRGADIDVIPTVITSFGGAPAERLLTNARWRSRHAAALVSLVRRNGYDGIDLDYETIALTTSVRRAVRIRAGYTALVRELCPRLRAIGKRCIVTVMPRWTPRFEVWHGKLIPAIYDYAALSAAADRMRIMAYDQHTGATTPGPIAGMPWVRSIVAYARTEATASRLELGIPLYGRNWGGGRTLVVTGPEAEQLRRRVGATARWSAPEQAPYFRYRGHLVWYSDARATLARATYAREQGFAGVALWAAGQEQAAVWDALD